LDIEVNAEYYYLQPITESSWTIAILHTNGSILTLIFSTMADQNFLILPSSDSKYPHLQHILDSAKKLLNWEDGKA
jgi:hypothetical protein